MFEIPAYVGHANSISGLRSALDQPEFATAIGLVKFGSFQRKRRATGDRRNSDPFRRVVSLNPSPLWNDMDNQTDNSVEQPVARLKVFGVGSAGISVINRLMQTPHARHGVRGRGNRCRFTGRHRGPRGSCCLNPSACAGLGTGGDPARGAKAAEENLSELKTLCRGAEIVFVVTGLGGGTGTGVSPVIAPDRPSGGSVGHRVRAVAVCLRRRDPAA